ncbi:MAG: homoserine dehydrogenase [Defluviitaleaceae bacterium]|nr:homoserine dehydrogenase [Defluviitaleaceae bacterium]
MVKIAILGYGIVGSGIMQVLEQNRVHIEKKAGCAVEVKRVLDKRDLSKELPSIYTNDFETILNDDEIQIVAEVMGGLYPAYDFVKQALLRGKHVCTSNKELVIKHGAELLSIAEEKDLNFMFEASVGGGIPVVRPLNTALTTDEIVAISGILNGTSNYVLTQMSNLGKSYDEALAEAQHLGYAEKDPTADVGGFDACRKLAILMSLATGKQVDFEEILTEGIQNINQIDFAFARAFGFTIKHMIDGRITPSGVSARAVPMLVHQSSPIAAVTGVFNGVMVQAKATDSVMFYGRGAGKFPTAGAVVTDIVDIAKHLHRHIQFSWSSEKIDILPFDSYKTRKLVRLRENKTENFHMAIPAYPGQIAWLTQSETDKSTKDSLKGLNVERILRVYEPMETVYDQNN